VETGVAGGLKNPNPTEPQPITLDGLPKRPVGRPPKPKVAGVNTAIRFIWKSTYAVPAIAGYGEHWKLAEVEAAELAEQTEAMLAAWPGKTSKWILQFLQVWSPAIALVTTAAMLTGVRIAETRRLYALARQSDEARAAQNAGPNGGRGPAGASEAPPAGRAASRVAELFDERDGPGAGGPSPSGE
jgi:hypothetical protein